MKSDTFDNKTSIGDRLSNIETTALPPSGEISQSQVIAEFGKGNNLLSYLGEGGVNGAPPLKLTDFYGKSAAVPTQFVTSRGASNTVSGSEHSENTRSIDLTGLGIKAGDLVLLCCVASGLPAGRWNMDSAEASGWKKMGSNQPDHNGFSAIRYWKYMGSSPESSFTWTTFEYAGERYDLPSFVVVFRGYSGGRGNNLTDDQTGNSSIFNVSTANVEYNNSLHIIVGHRSNNAENNPIPGWVSLGHGMQIFDGSGWVSTRCHVWYKMGVNKGPSWPGEIQWVGSYGRTTATTHTYRPSIAARLRKTKNDILSDSETLEMSE